MAEIKYKYDLPYKGQIFFINGAIIEVKDSRINTCPNMACPVRDKCLEGCRYHIRIARDGVMQPCGIRTDNILNLMDPIVSDSLVLASLKSGGK